MAVSGKTKKELIEEISALKSRLKQLEHNEPRLRQTTKKTQGVPVEEGICVSDINIEWKPDEGLCTFEKLPIAMMWINSTLASLMSGVQAMVGTERFRLALQSEGRKSVEDDWQVISQFPDFKEGFKAIANIAAVAGWGDWKLIDMDDENKESLFRVWNSWESQYQKSLGVCWGSGLLAGKLAGCCSRLFNTNCWADQTAFIARGDEFDEFRVRPSERSIEKEIENLLATDEATRADMAVALEKLRLEITTRKKAEEAMKKSSVIIDSTTDAVVCTDTVGNITFWNKGAEKIYGYRKEEAIGKPVSILYKDQDLHVLNSIITDLLEGKDIPGIEVTCINKNKQDVEILLSLTSIKDEEGNVSELVGITKDITERKKWQEALRQSEQKFRMFFENEPEYCYMVSPEGIILEANSAVLKALGYTKEELIGKKLEALYAPESCERTRQLFSQWKKSGEIRNVEMVIITKNGDRRTVLLSSAQVLSDDGKLLHSVSIQRDITDQKQVEKALRESEEKHRSLFNQIVLGVYLHDLDGRILDVNPTACKQLGYSRDELLQLTIFDLLPAFTTGRHNADTVNLSKDEILRQWKHWHLGQRTILEAEHQRKDGTILPVEISTGPVCYRGSTFILAVVQDITDRKQGEERLRHSEEKFRSMFELSPYSTILSDLEGNIIACNQQFTKLHATKEGPGAQIGRNVLEFFSKEEQPRLSSSIQNTITAGKNLGQFEYTMLRENGTKFRAETRSTVVMDKDGEPQALLAMAQDITERKLAEERLRQSEERFKILFESAPDAYYIHDLEGHFIDGNKAAEQLVGYGKEEVLGKNSFELGLVAEDDIPKIRVAMAENKDGKPAGPLELTVYRQDGSKVMVETRSYPVEIGGQTVVLGIARDVTERKRLEEAYQGLVDNSLQGLAIIQDGRMVFLNKAFSSSTGYSREELLAASPEQIQSFVHPDDREMVWARHRDRIVGKAPPDRYEFRWIRKDGSICWVEIHASQIEYQGRPAIQAAYIDITERKKAEEALRQSEERLKILFESAPDAIFLIDLKGNIVDGNKTAEKMIGYEEDELVRKNFMGAGLLPPEQVIKAIASLKRNAMGKPAGPDEYTLKRKNDGYVDVEMRTFPVKIGDQLLSLGIARDISDRKVAERKIFEHQAQLKSLASELSLAEERERHRLATDLHDQISQSLVFSRIKLQQLHASVSSEEIAKPLEEVYKNLDRIIQDTRTLTFDLSSPILYELGFEAAVAEWLEEQIGKKHGIKTQFEDDGQPKPLEDDIQVLLFRNVRELLINVVKHANARNVRVSISRIHKLINICIEDDGIGFNPDEATSSKGFGIFSIRERLEQLAGSIQIESEPGQGCKIMMIAPLKGSKE